ncbi:hypothetical protein Tco_1082569 [Tanacetum coccineum]|uniref:Reverse transcriptase domain-containing protein n=1 Tax=Tanacetum coccineum TaxID=301880 RepID=A0ABQ5I1N4_9ASTR
MFGNKSPPDHPKDKSGLDASAKLTRAKLNKRSGDADLSRDKSGPESPPELQRSWYVEGHVRSGVISSVLAQRYLRTIRQRYSPREGPQSLGARTRDAGTETHGGPTKPVLQTQKTPSPSSAFIKENIEVLRTIIKEHDQQAKMKATPIKLAYADSDKEALARSLARGFSDRFSLESSDTSNTHRQTHSASKSQRTPSKNKEPTHLRRSRRLEDWSITKEKAKRKRSKSRRKKSGHQETSSDSEHEEGSKDAYEDLNFPYQRPKPTPFTQRITRFKYHRRAKLPRNIRVYKENKDLEDHLGIFSAAAEQEEWSMPIWCKMFRQTLEGATRNWFDDLDPKSVDSFEELSQKLLEEFSQQKRCLSAFLHGHGLPAESCQSSNDKNTKRWMKCSKESEPSLGEKWPLGPQKWSILLKGTKDTFTPLTKTSKEILAMESVSFPEPPPLIGTPKKQSLNKFCDYLGDRGHNTNNCYQLKKQIEEVVASGKLAHLVKDIRRTNQRNGSQGRYNVKVINMIRKGGNRKRSFEEERILVDGESSSKIMYEHCFRNLDVSIRPRLRRCEIPMVGFSGETYHPLGIIDLRVTMGKARRNKTVLMEFAIIKCRSPYNVIIRITRMRSLGVVGLTIHSMIKFPSNQGIVTMETSREALWECRLLERVQGLRKEVQSRCRSENKFGRTDEREVFIIGLELPDQYVMMGATFTANYKQLLAKVLRENMEVFAWTRSRKLAVPRFVMEHQLKIYPHAEPMAYKRQPMAPKGRLSLKEKVFHWLKEGLIRKVQYPEWITNAIPIKLEIETWNYSRLNSQIRMAEDDEEKTGFHMEEGVYCFTHMAKEFKNSTAILQRMMEKVLADQRGQNMEIYLEEVVIKSKSKMDLVQDVEETLRKLKRVNIKINPVTSSFGVKEGSYPKLLELKNPIREVQMRLETTKGPGWINEDKEALQRIKRKLWKLQTLVVPKEGEDLMLEKEGVHIPISYVSRPLQGIEICYYPTKKMIQTLIHTTRSLIAIFRKHKVKVVTDGPIEEILKLSKKGPLAKWVTEIRTYDISYIPRKEAEGSVVKKFSSQGEQV